MTAWLGGVLVAVGLAVVPSVGVQAATTQGITGTVVGDGAGPVGAGVWVVPVDPGTVMGGGIVHSPCVVLCHVYDTESVGSFDIALPAGEYWLYVTAHTGDWAPEWWADAATRETSTKVRVEPGQVTRIDVELEHGGTVGGRLDQVDSADDALVHAWLPDPTFPAGLALVESAPVAADGTYRLTGLPTGAYRVRFVARTSRLEGWWRDGSTAATATPVDVVAGETVAGIDPVLQPWGTIKGRVVRAVDGTPLGGVSVEALWDDPLSFNRQPGLTTTSAADGTYILPVMAGTHRLMFRRSDFRGEFWNDAFRPQDGDVLTVARGQVTAGIDIALDPSTMTSTSRPVISGVPRVGSLLSATAGGWYPSGASHAYQWRRDGALIAGAVTSTYRPTAADVGHRIEVGVTASRADYATGSAASVPVRIAPGILRVGPVPAIRGTYRVRHWLRAVAPVTSPAASTTHFRWLRNGRPISGATASTYRLTTADRGQRVSVRITLSRPGHTRAIVTAVRPGRVG